MRSSWSVYTASFFLTDCKAPSDGPPLPAAFPAPVASHDSKFFNVGRIPWRVTWIYAVAVININKAAA